MERTARIKTGISVLDRVLTELVRCAGIQVVVHCEGDRHIDDHHTAEDVAITLGQVSWVFVLITVYTKLSATKRGLLAWVAQREPTQQLVAAQCSIYRIGHISSRICLWTRSTSVG